MRSWAAYRKGRADLKDISHAAYLRTLAGGERHGRAKRERRINLCQRYFKGVNPSLVLGISAARQGEDKLIEAVVVWTAEEFLKYAKECKICLFT